MIPGTRRVPGKPGWLALIACLALSTPAVAGPILLDVFYEFSFTDPGVGALGCAPADPAGDFCIPSSGTPTTFLDAPPWTFDAPAEGIVLTVTDAFTSGDRFEVLDFGVPLGFTSLPVLGLDCGDDPVPCLATAGISSAVFILGAGGHSITIAPSLSPEGGGAGYLHITGITGVPEPGAWPLLAVGLLALGFLRHKSLRGVA